MTTGKIRIRAARQSDREPVAEMWLAMSKEHRGYDADFWNWHENAGRTWAQRLEQLIDNDAYVVLVAEDSDGLLAGFVVAAKGETGVYAQPRGEIWDLYVCPEHRTLGVGTKLMEQVFADLKAIGVREAVLHVAIANKPAVAFYEKLGMNPVMYRMFKKL